MLGNAGSCNNEGNGFSLCPGFVFKCVSARNVRNPLYLGFEKGFIVAAPNKIIYKFISTHYVIVVVGANAAKAKCKTVRNRTFSVLTMTRRYSKYWCLSVGLV